ncbi:hypothetical protein GCM10009133_39850 [Cocleimonas flava]|uniref:Uncharacterized protein n=1 Tax=Cocleimonas flava TaxID=634765 RepID=A0A4R1F225_9GAMM|nr:MULTISPECIES: hypothetical protein [Cocleimonas]MEB8434074.1 hypothetical protein [Cocleimonas sp. KMM 6892]MEC4717066.1 hypothetical protein [Cocleimonas sp. KMM 6895]MEC4746346.1 hypothetical protein [Cocleimonas sp. KMM 6896]TCJ88177.1 hypothetical protein EV695_0016 [Cocleimonas flava]
MKPLFHTKLSTKTTAALLAVFSLFFSTELLASGCSKADIEFYLQKGFTHEQVTKLCSIPTAAPAAAPYQGQPQQGSPESVDQAYLAAALDANNVTINQNRLSYTSKECVEYGPPNNTDLIEEACANTTVTVNFAGLKIRKISNGFFLIKDAQFLVEGDLKREFLNLNKVRRQDKSEVVRLLPTNPKRVNIPIRRGIDPEEVAQRIRKYIR